MIRGRIRIACALLAALAGCATRGHSDAEAESRFDLAPYAQHERCVDLAEGDRLQYRWEATAPLAFDIRYASGGAIVLPLAQSAQVEGAGIFAASLATRHCLSWEAGERGAGLDYRMRISRRHD